MIGRKCDEIVVAAQPLIEILKQIGQHDVRPERDVFDFVTIRASVSPVELPDRGWPGKGTETATKRQ